MVIENDSICATVFYEFMDGEWFPIEGDYCGFKAGTGEGDTSTICTLIGNSLKLEDDS